jgi:hypothetical protein
MISSKKLVKCVVPRCLADGKCNQTRKRSSQVRGSEPLQKRGACAQKLTEVEEIVSQLKAKHGSAYTVEKLNAWAHMIHIMGKQTSHDLPPDLPYFKGAKKVANDENKGIPATGAMSPGKRINLRTECMDQLQKWHGLLQMGAITSGQYDEFQKKIIGDIADL